MAVVQLLSRVRLFVTPWTVARQAPLSIEFSRQEYWGGLLFLPPVDLPDAGIKPESLASPALAGGFSTTVPYMSIIYQYSWKKEHFGSAKVFSKEAVPFCIPISYV